MLRRACSATLLTALACGGGASAPATSSSTTAASSSTGAASSASTTSAGGQPGTGGTAGSGGADAGPGCLAGVAVAALRACLDGGEGPDPCVAKLSAPLCDRDGDGLGDDLEAALALAYGPVFAFNGGAYGGDPETHWPVNVQHFVAHSELVHRPDGASAALVDAQPTLATLGQEKLGALDAGDPAVGQGSDFWLCLTDQSDATRVTSKELMLALPGGVDVEVVAHPANGALADSSHLFVSFGLVFAYNQHTNVDDHEGDRESIELFVDRQTGAVDAVWFDRHSTQDKVQFVDVATYGAHDPSLEAPYGNVGSPSASTHGLRFWDHGGERHHVVAYVGTGGHAMYDYPANTYILIIGPRDTHDGDGPKLLSWTGDIVPGWDAISGEKVAVHVQNPGEPTSFVLPWARFRGQWGCTDDLIAKSWPGPFGNARHPRPVFERKWGSPPSG